MKKILIATLLFSASIAQAESKQIGAIDSIILNKKTATVLLTDASAVKVGSKVTIAFTDGVNCETEIKAVSGKKAQIDLNECERFIGVKKGQAVSLSDFQEEEQVVEPVRPHAVQTPPVVTEPLSKRIKFAIGVTAGDGGGLDFDEAEFTIGGTKTKGELSYDTTGAVGLTAEVLYAQPNKAGFGLGLTIETPRKITGGTAKTNGAAYLPTSTGAETKVQFTTLFANFIYRFDVPYIYLGLNASAASFSNAPTVLSRVDGGTGGQIGLGFFVNDHLGIDVGIKSLGLMGDRVSDGAVTVEPGLGSIASFNGTLKYIF